MGLYLVTVDSVTNSVSAGSVAAGTVAPAAVLTFTNPLTAGDVLTIQTPLTEVWSSGGGPGNTNADGVALVTTPGTGQVTVDWTSYSPGQPSTQASYPAATNYNFGIGCLVGSLDGCLSFFTVGTKFTTTILGNGLLASTNPPSIPTLSLVYWDVNNNDNVGAITFTVTVTRAAQ
jgi:hypothetical protein